MRGATTPAGILALAFLAVSLGPLEGEPSPVGRAGALFVPVILDLELDGQDGVTGTIGSDKFSPGEAVEGHIDLTVDGLADMDPGLFDLDIDFQDEVFECHELYEDYPHCSEKGLPLPHWLILTKLQYGNDDLLGPPGRDLVREIDGHPQAGNQDGLLSLFEMRHGSNDLPLPGPSARPTPFDLGVEFKFVAPNSLQGDGLNLTIVFLASDALHEDLN